MHVSWEKGLFCAFCVFVPNVWSFGAATASADVEYPLYCSKVSTPAQQLQFHEKRQIPSLSSDTGLELLQVQVVIRHGARLPLVTEEPCWKGYVPVKSDCVVKNHVSSEILRASSSSVEKKTSAVATEAQLPESQFLAPPKTVGSNTASTEVFTSLGDVNLLQDIPLAGLVLRKRLLQETAASASPEDAHSSYASLKKFDYAPWSSTSGRECLAEQLLGEGATQQDINGQVLAKTYGDWLSSQVNSTSELLDRIYFRSTDYQRTIASGQFLLTSLLKASEHRLKKGSEIELHTMEFDREFLDNSPKTYCPAVLESYARYQKHLKAALKADPDYLKANELLEASGMNYRVDGVFQAQDCLIQALCMDNRGDLPQVFKNQVEPSKVSPDLRFVLNQLGRAWMNAFSFMSGDLSRRTMHRFWIDAGAFLYKRASELVPAAALTNAFDSLEPLFTSPRLAFVPKNQLFVLWSTHDSTIASYLDSIDPRMFEKIYPELEWGDRMVPLASMLTTEFYWDVSANSVKFRVIYNGKVITSFIEDCGEVCELRTLVQRLSSFVKPEAYPFGYCRLNSSASTETLLSTAAVD